MFTRMAEAQADAVNALLDTIEYPDWTHAWVHAEFLDENEFLAQYNEAFIAILGDAPERLPLPIEPDVARAFETMFAVYRDAGQAFARLDLLVSATGPYRFDLDDTPSLILAARPDPAAKGRLDRRFAELVRDGGI